MRVIYGVGIETEITISKLRASLEMEEGNVSNCCNPSCLRCEVDSYLDVVLCMLCVT